MELEGSCSPSVTVIMTTGTIIVENEVTITAEAQAILPPVDGASRVSVPLTHNLKITCAVIIALTFVRYLVTKLISYLCYAV